ncbi:MAG: sodium-dependent transporter [Candidatus Amulumruptor caecigallinarius]|nr:sodium-dependent transporter [Candidatus Amulumruptor caecigallinarius]MCM1397767.1 sodium-dependent transporter [Candidatus Amulumruptor caecigallinarius]
MAKKAQFSSRIGLVAATVGSAVGLGNVWRFPAEVQANGGASFLLIYILCVLLLGIPVMLAEFALGRGGGSDAAGSFLKLGAAKPWQAVGWLAIAASYLILCFYTVVGGWTLEYLIQSITGNLYVPVPGAESLKGMFTARMNQFITTDINPLLNTYAVIVITLAVLLAGVQKGIERVSNILMPLLFILLLIFCLFSLTLPRAQEGLAYFFHPDFSKITGRVVLSALGQAFFSLSLGMGILITYAAYFPKDARLTRTAFTVSLLDLTVAILMGIIIFPAVVSFDLGGESLRGATLVFVTLPEVFSQMHLTRLWSSLFFLLLLVASVTSIISIAEVSVAFLVDRFRLRRRNACFAVLIPLFALSALCSLSMGSLSYIKIAGLNIFDFLDHITSAYMLTLAALFTCIYIGWFAPKGLFIDELTNGRKLHSTLAPILLTSVKWLCPLLITAILLSEFIK